MLALDVWLPTQLDAVPAAARLAEAAGFDGANVGETSRDSFMALTLAAEHSSRIGLATDILIAFPRSPMIVANAAWELQRFSRGRFTLGLGPQVKGHIERRFSVRWTPPATRMREYVLALREIFRAFQEGDAPRYIGEQYAFTLLPPLFNPGPLPVPPPPIHIAAVNPGNARLAGEVCDGVKLHRFSTPRYFSSTLLPAIADGLARAGRSRRSFELCQLAFVATGFTEAEIAADLADIRSQLAFYGSTRTYGPVLEAHGWGDLVGKLHEASLSGGWAEMPRLISDEMLAEFAVIGRYDEIGAKIAAKYGGIVDRVAVTPRTLEGGHGEAWRSVIEDVHRRTAAMTVG